MRHAILMFAVLPVIGQPIFAAELPSAPTGTFSIAVIPDTQHYRGQKSKAQPPVWSRQPILFSRPMPVGLWAIWKNNG